MSDLQLTITAKELYENADKWAGLIDSGRCKLIYKGDYVDGIGVSDRRPDRYYIEYGGIVNDPEAISADTVIEVKWS